MSELGAGRRRRHSRPSEASYSVAASLRGVGGGGARAWVSSVVLPHDVSTGSPVRRPRLTDGERTRYCDPASAPYRQIHTAVQMPFETPASRTPAPISNSRLPAQAHVRHKARSSSPGVRRCRASCSAIKHHSWRCSARLSRGARSVTAAGASPSARRDGSLAANAAYLSTVTHSSRGGREGSRVAAEETTEVQGMIGWHRTRRRRWTS